MSSAPALTCALPDFMPHVSDGDVLFTGHQIGLHHLLEKYNEGNSPEMLVCHYPTLSLSVVHRAIAF